jgi:hypothetical protein
MPQRISGARGITPRSPAPAAAAKKPEKTA